ncbi:MAG: DsbA family protein [Myxococcota bacterium]|jgi:protein-disulfide isomerase|nr:DsbA family protein [Myxococcota bacterium]
MKSQNLFPLVCLTASLVAACSGGQRFIAVQELAGRIDVSQLTPVEVKRLEKVLNREVSPCGDAVTLAESLFNTERCPLSTRAAAFIIERIKLDFNEKEISAAYVGRYASLKGLEIPIDGSPVRGAAKPVVTVAIFTDFECPFCSQAASAVEEIERRHPEEVAVVYKAFPLSIHPMAELAARSGFAAHRQGKFWEMHDTLFSATGTPLSRERIEVMAEGLGIEVEQFNEDLASSAATAAIAADQKLGKSLGVDGTPSIFVNGRKLEVGTDGLQDRVTEELIRIRK